MAETRFIDRVKHVASLAFRFDPLPPSTDLRFVEPDPKAVDKDVMVTPQAEADIMGSRRPVAEAVSAGLTPERLAALMRDSAEGDPEAYLALAEEMEEKDLHYLSVLGTRKRQVAQLPMSVEAPTDAADNDPATALAQELVDSGVIDRALFDILDAVGKGVAFPEIMWKLTAKKWEVRDIAWRDPRFFDWDRATRTVPLLRQAGGQLVPLPPYKFIFMQIKAKSGIPIRGGLARAVAWAWLFKNYSLKDWVQFAESYGQPLRIGKYAPGATDDEKRSLLRAVAAMGSDFGAIINNTMALDFIEAGGKAASADLYEKFARYLDEQVSKAVLGQTGTTDATPGKLGGSNDHTKVREDIERADAVALSAALNFYLVRPYIDLNLGPQEKYPWLKIGRVEEDDVELMLKVAEFVVDRGGEICADQLTEAVGFRKPKDGEKVLTPVAKAPAPGDVPPVADAQLAHRLSLLASLGTAPTDGLAAGAAVAAAGWQEDMGPIADQVKKIMLAATSYDDFLRRLTELWPKLDVASLQDRAARFCFQAQLGGLAGEGVRPGMDEPDPAPGK